MIGKHKNIINLLGACTQDGKHSEPLLEKGGGAAEQGEVSDLL